MLTLIVAGAVIGVIGTWALWASRQALDTRAWTETSSRLLRDDEVQAVLAAHLVDALFASVDVRAELQTALPPDAQGLAAPATAGLRVLGERIALAALDRPAVQRLWEAANQVAHRALIAALRGDSEVLATTGGVVTLNLVPLVEEVGARLGLDVEGRIPADVGNVQILRSDRIARARAAARTVRVWGIVLPVVTLGLLALAVLLARGWRREALEDVGAALAAVGVVVLISRGVVGAYLVESLAASPATEPAARSVWEIGTSLLASSAVASIVYGIVILFGAWLAGPSRAAIRTRRRIAPFLQRRRFGYAALAAILVLVFAWDPVPATGWVVPSVILVALAVFGLEALRRVSLRDRPAERGETPTAEPPMRKAG